MEKRAILAAVLMFALLTVYQYVFAPTPEPPPPAPAPGAAQPAPKPATNLPAGASGAPAPAVTPPVAPLPATPVADRETVIETPLYRARVRSTKNLRSISAEESVVWMSIVGMPRPLISVRTFSSADRAASA